MSVSSRRTIALSIALIASSIFAGILLWATTYAPENNSFAPAFATTSPAMLAGEAPSMLSIPSLQLHADVQQVGLTKSGAMGVPSNFTDVAWYKYGPLPGQPGSAVIDGHVDNGLALPGVFKHLDQIQKGADIYVTTTKGHVLHFVVTDIQRYPYTATPNGQIFTTTGAARLNLITCTGSWVPAGRTYDQRLVVFTTLAA